jgi:CelD/BcsL family acetyltransferase involved in cellulose biosynthesis
VISNSDKIAEMESDWNAMVNASCNNPFLLSEFVKQFIDSNRSTRWVPLILVISFKNSTIGIAPFMVGRKLGVRFVKFVYESLLSPDFIVQNKYRDICIASVLDFLFKTLQCKFTDIPLSADSPSLGILRKQSGKRGISFKISAGIEHRKLPIKGTWTEFEKSRGRNFRQKFKKIERKLDQAGSWKVVCIDGNDESETVKKILAVERTSWKEKWRVQRGEKTDKDLMAILQASLHTAGREPDFKWKVWFLELNRQTLAYLLVLQYKKIAFITKGSYNEKYKRFYPGIYIRNYVIHELFNKGEVRSIDFLTNLPYHRTWTSICVPRVRVALSKGVVPTIARFVFESAGFKKIRLSLLNPFIQHLAI